MWLSIGRGLTTHVCVGGRSAYRTLGGSILSHDEHSWTLGPPRWFTLLPNGSGFTITNTHGRNVTFRGVPAPGVNASAHALVHSGTRNYGVVRAANGKFVLQTDILWNGQKVHKSHGVSFVILSICSFTSSDGWTWDYGGVIANWSAVHGNTTDPAPGDVLHPVMWGPSEADMVMMLTLSYLF